MLPHFLCIGAQKAGTSWLFANLNQHPSVWMPPIKELHYFDHLFVPDNRRWTNGHIRNGAAEAIRWHLSAQKSIEFSYLRYLSDIVTESPFTEDWYKSLFSRPGTRGRVLGDITPEYSTIPLEGIDYVRRLLGSVKIIYIVRDPVGRALSQLRMNLQRTNSDPSNEADWMKAALSPEIFNRGDYRTYIPNWLSRFASNDILFIPYKQIGSSPRLVMDKVEQLLGVERYDGYPHLDTLVHETRKIKIPDFVKAELELKLAPQKEFLVEHFGQEFVNLL